MISEYELRDRPERLVVNPTWTGSAPSGITIKIPCCGSIGVHSGFIVEEEEEVEEPRREGHSIEISREEANGEETTGRHETKEQRRNNSEEAQSKSVEESSSETGHRHGAENEKKEGTW